MLDIQTFFLLLLLLLLFFIYLFIYLFIYFFFSEFGFNLMCHNPMRSIILGSVPEFHRIVTHHVGTKF
jgi:hypothetical protein